MKIAENILARIGQSRLSPEHFVKGFAALLAGVNLTGNQALNINIDFANEDEPVAPDELIPIITLSFRGSNGSQEIRQEARQEACQSNQEANAQVAAQDNAQVA